MHKFRFLCILTVPFCRQAFIFGVCFSLSDSFRLICSCYGDSFFGCLLFLCNLLAPRPGRGTALTALSGCAKVITASLNQGVRLLCRAPVVWCHPSSKEEFNMSKIQKIYDYLKQCNGFFFASCDGDKPRVRPDERTPGTPGRSEAGFTAFERPKDGGT